MWRFCLVINPVIQRAELAQSQGQLPNIPHIKLLTDSIFFNSLHSHVNSWIKAIQEVTKLTRGVSSSTALQNQLLVERDRGAVEEYLQPTNKRFPKTQTVPLPNLSSSPIVEAISRDFNDIHLWILTSHWLEYTPYPTSDSEHLLPQTTARGIFRTWDDLIKEFTNVAREVTRKRSEKIIPIKVVLRHGKLVERVRYLREWRKQHEQ
ncbi:uncharacterized protein LACBIDRAFT_299671 [Laccaria bicolor S238N-H82]|uniref:Predicted protein n=1 Tax=Laccaria bicolor (strain S238N-H82 / ATCC MYA-4686) TaxID=486041 RepID=B0DF48_LACBS|nr:uncharacterized protein LACBIDRAFT_299671 [Laccaria bicolor S238N-H82]EDR06790.1 predicted protein [Laccaria bicolor S238N-H82]|eukprot:XP_001882637.1 predicted protein [Laccaria bicolor S238N-H82]